MSTAERLGRTEDEWNELVEAAIDFLKDRAALQKTSSYTEINTVLARRTGQPLFDFNQGTVGMSRLLANVNDRTMSEMDGLLLSSLVVHLNDNDAGHGFYTYAIEKGRLGSTAGKDERERFLMNEISAVHARFRRPSRPRRQHS